MVCLKRCLVVSLLLATSVLFLYTSGEALAASAVGHVSKNSRIQTSVRENTRVGYSGSNSGINRLMTAVAAVPGKAGDIWAVGYSFTSSDIPQTLAEHWNGSKWTIVSSPNVGTGDNYLNAVTAIAKNDIWAAGDYFENGYFHPLLEQWNGTSWSIVTAASVGPGSHLQGLAAISTNTVWTVGYYFNGTVFQTLIEQWNGSSWNAIASPNVGTGNNYLMSITAISATNVWAVGHYDNGFETPGYTLIEHWDGTSWSVISSPNVGTNGSELWSVAAGSKNNIWAVGEYNNGSVFQTLTEHWNGTSWSVIASPNVGTGDNLLNGVAVDTKSDVLAVGNNGSGQTLIEHWDGTQWEVVSSPNIGTNIQLSGVITTSTSNAWAVGSYLTPSTHYRALYEHWNGTKWSIVSSPS